MSDIKVESVFQFEKLSRAIVNNNMFRISKEDEWLVVELMTQCFKYGIQFEKQGYCIVKGDNNESL